MIVPFGCHQRWCFSFLAWTEETWVASCLSYDLSPILSKKQPSEAYRTAGPQPIDNAKEGGQHGLLTENWISTDRHVALKPRESIDAGYSNKIG
jgi:hypothetical protein